MTRLGWTILRLFVTAALGAATAVCWAAGNTGSLSQVSQPRILAPSPAGGEGGVETASRACGERSPRPLNETGPVPRAAPKRNPQAVEAAIRRGIDFLLTRQNKDGSWGSAHHTHGMDIYAPVPGAHQAFRAAVTSMCISALIETSPENAEAMAAVDRAEAWLLAHLAEVRRATPDTLYNNWAHAYAIDALVRLLDRKPEDRKRGDEIRRLVEGQIDRLTRYECVDGGWCYYDFVAETQKPSGSSMCFVTATVLVSLYEAKEHGFKIPDRLIDRAVASIRRQRKPDFSYCYGEYLKYEPMTDINRPGGSLGRSQACNLALRLWGGQEVTDRVLTTWLDRLFARNLWLDMARKNPVPHDSWFHVAAYFFYYAHYYAARCIDQLKPAQREPYYDHLAEVLLKRQEKDGSWWDFPLYDYHQQYGTAFALMSLNRCRQHGVRQEAREDRGASARLQGLRNR